MLLISIANVVRIEILMVLLIPIAMPFNVVQQGVRLFPKFAAACTVHTIPGLIDQYFF